MAVKMRSGEIGLKQRAARQPRSSISIRSGFAHALHLAAASEHGAAVSTLDERLAEACPVLGVPAQLLA